jgi:hypothetical protein
MFPDQDGVFSCQMLQCGDYLICGFGISQRYRDVSLPTGVTDPANRTAFGAIQKFALTPAGKLGEVPVE